MANSLTIVETGKVGHKKPWHRIGKPTGGYFYAKIARTSRPDKFTKLNISINDDNGVESDSANWTVNGYYVTCKILSSGKVVGEYTWHIVDVVITSRILVYNS
jgi:hypothetical protein